MEEHDGIALTGVNVGDSQPIHLAVTRLEVEIWQPLEPLVWGPECVRRRPPRGDPNSPPYL